MSESLTFSQLALPEPLLRAVTELGYETPSPIQAAAIPKLLAGEDLLGQAQTGTGKTAAFALPLLARLDPAQNEPQILVLAPTRELAIQVAEAFQAYARFMPAFHVLPLYGGQSYTNQLKSLKRGSQVIVGTPGRILDHLDRGTLKLDKLRAIVLDEADEMLRMGFIDDVQTIMDATPAGRQVAMFSATMPSQIRAIAQKHLKNAHEIKIESKTSTVERISQRYVMLDSNQKLDALTRVLEGEEYDASIIFVRTKSATEEIAEKLGARGYAVACLNGDMNQANREQTIRRLKASQIDVIVATDVAARGLDVERISLVINYDIPYDSEAYVHRIGRTGRAGREGKAILFVSPRERRLLRTIEVATRQPIEKMSLPTGEVIEQRRIESFRETLANTIEAKNLSFFQDLINDWREKLETTDADLAAALLFMAQKDQPLNVAKQFPEIREPHARGDRPDRAGDRPARFERGDRPERSGDRPERAPRPRREMQGNYNTYRIEVGKEHGVRAGDIVGAIANEANIDSQFIGNIKLFDHFSTVELPADIPTEIFQHLKKVYVRKQKLNISVDAGGSAGERTERPAGDRRPSSAPTGAGPRPGAAPKRRTRE
ncbi:MAG: DEAD/DEAH box helicase [Gammaproteobacteria bacterium]|jgi:ATP-dependent RNA helicase DeaD|nr:DEAD/DEAH box helicase [Gammaproteobacteria bacterium]MBU2181369.1 DEAD/DEAH box helicase [Gammaproteobacteria bacterium]MBU2225773.1 DEAD/DEAH box helicase [Gammaproteobacteria bacterium]MBU2277366.1 DEAD/DEAH box helicase [Gammaproteobacteria bacterium]MBU2427800.1 DEAD/DEAH box helicase [Gammaproteobacteria bacterium]